MLTQRNKDNVTGTGLEGNGISLVSSNPFFLIFNFVVFLQQL